MADTRLVEQHLVFMIKAKQDLVLVREVLNSTNIAPEILLFHLQQAVEKLIKTLLTFNKIKFPKTHDLEDLVELAEDSSIDLPSFVEQLVELSPYAVEARYAILHDDVHDISQMLQKSEQFMEFVEEKVSRVTE